ncbi:MAG TPA: EI24 domain-containing protein [Streptosporangiaceae bacterium]|nr:EI24 domain-containing protein [Streptosporangiaceae bacterium]
MSKAVRDAVAGVGYFARGVAWTARRPRQWLFGLVPALIALALYAAALAVLIMYADDLATAITPFVDDWPGGPRRAVRIIVGVGIVGAGTLFAVLTFTALTLLVGEPFYERLAVRTEESMGGAPPEAPGSAGAELLRSVGDAIVLGVFALGFAAVFFALGLLPGIGQTVVPVLAACVSGYFLSGELTGIALTRRGLRRRERFARLRRERPLAIGFGVAVFVVFLIPLGAVVAMPGAVVGATMLARERLGEDVAGV